jgi:hypothetical protein
MQWIVFQNIQVTYYSTPDISFLSDDGVLQVLMFANEAFECH